MKRGTPLLLALLAFPACNSDTIKQGMLVTVNADTEVTGIVQLKVTVTNAGTDDHLLLPSVRQSKATVFPTKFSISMPPSCTGRATVVVEGLDSSELTAASGSTFADLVASSYVPASVKLSRTTSPCAGGQSCADASVGQEVGAAADAAESPIVDTGALPDSPMATAGTGGLGTAGAGGFGGSTASGGANGLDGGAPGSGGATGRDGSLDSRGDAIAAHDVPMGRDGPGTVESAVGTDGVGGAGGALGTGGIADTGAPATGGVSGSGGVAGTGGATASGGASNTGGIMGTGGLTGTGGAGGTPTPIVAGIPSWQRRAPATSAMPAPRVGHSVAYDPSSNSFVLFGGFLYGTGGDQNDTWRWDPVTSTWTDRSTASRPSPRRSGFLFFDKTRQKILLFGGGTSGASPIQLTDLWELDSISGNWTDVTPVGPRPSFDCAYQCSGAYDRTLNRALFFDLGGLWAWDGSGWQQAAPSAPTVPISSPSLAFDPKRSRVILLAAANDPGNGAPFETWYWTASTWTRVAPAPELGPRIHQDMIFDETRSSVVFYGGYQLDATKTLWQPQADTWEWDGGGWAAADSAVKPPAIGEPALAYDPLRGKVVLFLDTNGDVWEYQVASIPNGSACSSTFASRCQSGVCLADICRAGAGP
jgi:hypothetical protein